MWKQLLARSLQADVVEGPPQAGPADPAVAAIHTVGQVVLQHLAALGVVQFSVPQLLADPYLLQRLADAGVGPTPAVREA